MKQSCYMLLAFTPLALLACKSEPKSEFRQPPDQLTREAQVKSCPPDQLENLAEITLADGRIADVEIIDLPGGRIYLPRPWIKTPAPYYADGVRVTTATNALSTPWRGVGAQTDCRAQAYQINPAREQQAAPRLTLGIIFNKTTTQSANGEPKIQTGEWPVTTQVLSYHFRGPENAPITRPPVELVYAGHRLSFMVAPEVEAEMTVVKDSNHDLWPAYEAKTKAIYAWLKTKPAERRAFPEYL